MKPIINYQHFTLPVIFAALLMGCAGKKSSSSSSEQFFSSWSATVPTKITNFTTGNATRVLANGTIQQTYSDVTAVTSFDVSRNLTAVTLRQSGLNAISFSISNGDTIVKDTTGNNFVLTNTRSTSIGIISNPFSYGFEYQTYGSWGNWGNVGAGSNAVSIGSFTPVNNVPVIGNATFQGGANGYYVANGLSYIASASMTANADFASRTITFTTADTKLVGNVSGTILNASSLNLSGSIAYGPNSNLLTGSVTSASGLSGSIVGNFYGPNANEIGGTFGLNKSSGETFVGGFGGKR